jgi:two-component system OmpR family sensor kinase
MPMTPTTPTSTPTSTMTERHNSTPPQPRAPVGSPVPARLRIVGWIMLTAALGLLAVVLTVRSALLSDVERAANAAVAQEVDEFRTFADRGRDPDTGTSFTSPDRLLALYLERQYPGTGEVLVGYDRSAPARGQSPLLVHADRDPFGLLAEPGLVQRLVDDPESSGTATTEESEFRWGKAEVTTATGDAGGVLLVTEFIGPGRAQADKVIELMALVSLGGLLFTAGIAYVVAGQILGPVLAVRRAASRITRADLNQRIEVRGRDDVAALAVTFNAMLDRLQQTFRVLQSLSAAAGRLLRAPLAVLGDERTLSTERDAAIAYITTILDDLDVLAGSQSPDFAVPVPTDVAGLTWQLAADVRALGRREWIIEASAGGTAEVDTLRVRQAVRCLALNALRQPSDEAPLRLGSRIVDDHVEFWVTDDGPGLTPERATRIFGHYRDEPVPTGSSADDGWPGLGLAVVRAVADAHHGSAWVETEPGRGTTFGLRLPLTAADRPAHDAHATGAGFTRDRVLTSVAGQR